MTRFRAIALWMFLLVVALPAVSQAQASEGRVQAEIDRTEQHIERARGIVAGSGSAAAQAELGRAVELQNGARAALAQGRPRIAVDMTLRARAGADRSVAIINGLPDPDRVLGQLDRTREMIENARSRIEECNQDRARALLRTADDMQRRAEEGGRGGHYLAALQLTMGARERALRALRQCNISGEGEGAAERALRRTDETIQRAQDRLGSDAPEPSRRMLERAIEAQSRAQAEYRDRHLESSVRLTLSARSLAVRAARTAGRAR